MELPVAIDPHRAFQGGELRRLAAEAAGVEADLAGPIPRFREPDRTLQFLMSKLRAEVVGEGYGTPLALESLLTLVGVHILGGAATRAIRDPGPGPGLSHAGLNRVLQLIEGRLADPPTLRQMAAVADLSIFHFSRLFKRSTGLPPHRYVLGLRIERAKALLRQRRAAKVSEIAFRLGFADEGHFRKHFKRSTGMTPGEFRPSQDRT